MKHSTLTTTLGDAIVFTNFVEVPAATFQLERLYIFIIFSGVAYGSFTLEIN